MTLILPPGYAQLVMGFSTPNVVTGRTAIVTGWGAPLGPEPTPLSTWLENIEEEIGTAVNNLFDTSVILDSLYAQNATQSVQRAVNLPGGQPFEAPPPNAAVLVSYGTEFKGRRGRGRTFLYGTLNETDVNEAGIVASGRLNAIQSAWGQILTGILTATTDTETRQVILQNTTPTVNPPANPTPPITPPPPVTSVSYSPRMATQRRRLRR